MSKSDDPKFVLLGCVASNLANDAYPFVIVVNESNENRTLTSYVLNGWQDIREFFPDDVREDVLYFLDSLGDYAPGEDTDRFFGHLHTLSVGPVRFIAGGTCSPKELDASISAMLETGKAPVLWPESFNAV